MPQNARIRLKWINNFLTVGRMLSVTKAAKLHNMAQPALTRQMQKLETALDVKLLEKRGRSIDLTPAGHTLMSKAADIIEFAEMIESDIQALQGLKKESIGLSTSTALSKLLGANLCRCMRMRHPEFTFTLEIDNAGGWRTMSEESMPFVLHSNSNILKDKRLHSTPLFSEYLFLVQHTDGTFPSDATRTERPLHFPLATLRNVELQKLSSDNALTRMLRNARVALQVDDPDLIMEALTDGTMDAVLPHSATWGHVLSGQMTKTKIEDAEVTYYLTRLHDRPATRSDLALQRVIAQEIQILFNAGLFGSGARFFQP